MQFVLRAIILVILSLMATITHAENTPLVVVLDWFVNPDHAPLFVAKHYGFFEKHNLTVQLINPADPSDAKKLVAAGKADIGISYQPGTMMAIDQGLPIVRIGSLVNRPLNSLTVLANSPIKTVADLRGKRIGYSTPGADHAALKTLLTRAGLTLDDVTLINVHYGLTQALMAGKVDAVTGMMRNIEPIQLELNGYPARVFYPEKYGMPVYDELIYIAHQRAQPDPRFARFLMAMKQATLYLKTHPQQTWRAFARAYPELNNEFNARAWQATVPYFSDDPVAMNAVDYAKYAAFLTKQGLTRRAVTLQRYSSIKNNTLSSQPRRSCKRSREVGSNGC